jgi:branched-chain amino acid transport system permease protein
VGSLTLGAPPGLGDAILALMMLAIIIFRPKGITGGKEISWPFGPSRD